MLKTRITEQYGLKVPFINAGMAFIATAPLARAVCEAGGMGVLSAPAMPPDALQNAIRDVKAVNPACFGVDIIARFSGIEHIEVCVTEKVPVVVFFWDDAPDQWLSRLKAAGSHIWFQVGSVDEAKAAFRRGVQGLVVQGSEAGGHNRAAAATFSFLPAVIEAVPSVPVLAAPRGRCGLGGDSPPRELRGQCPSAVQGPSRCCRRRGYGSPPDLRSGIP